MTTTTIEGVEVERITALMVPAWALRSLGCAVVAAGKDNTLPTLCAVRLEWGPGFLRAVATDRYRLAIITWNGSCPGMADNLIEHAPEGSALIPVKDFVAFVKGLPKDGRRGLPTMVMMYPEDGAVRFDAGDSQHTLRTLDGEFPKYEKLLPSEFADLPATGIAMNPGYVADVAKMPVERNCPVRVQFIAPNRPMVWTAGASDDPIQWKYLLMPVRIGQ